MQFRKKNAGLFDGSERERDRKKGSCDLEEFNAEFVAAITFVYELISASLPPPPQKKNVQQYSHMLSAFLRIMEFLVPFFL